MAIKKLYSVRDSKASYFMAPFVAVNEAIAVRNIRAAINQGNNDVAKFPEDHSLWYVGTFNEETGKISKAVPEHIANCVELVQEK